MIRNYSIADAVNLYGYSRQRALQLARKRGLGASCNDRGDMRFSTAELRKLKPQPTGRPRGQPVQI